MRAGASLCLSSRNRLLTLLLVILLCYTCTRTVHGSADLLGTSAKSLGKHIGGTSYRKKYFLFSQCSNRFVRMTLRSGHRSLDAQGSTRGKNAKLWFESVGHSGLIHIKGDRVTKYLCFNRRGRLILRAHLPNKERERCEFQEMYEEGYTRLQSVAQNKWSVGFNKKGRKMKGFKSQYLKKEKCFRFTKYDADEPVRFRPGPVGHDSVNNGVLKGPHTVRHQRGRNKRPKLRLRHSRRVTHKKHNGR